MTGEVEPTDDQCDWPEDEDDELAEEASEKLQLEDSGEELGMTIRHQLKLSHLYSNKH